MNLPLTGFVILVFAVISCAPSIRFTSVKRHQSSKQTRVERDSLKIVQALPGGAGPDSAEAVADSRAPDAPIPPSSWEGAVKETPAPRSADTTVIAEERGVAVWYGPGFEGKKTASGERFDPRKLVAAHRTLPFNTMVKVTNLDNGASVVVRICDRGPQEKDRIIDLSQAAARAIGLDKTGTANVLVEVVR